MTGRVASGQRRYHGGNDSTGGGIGADNQLAGGTKQGVDQHRQNAGVETDDGAYSGEFCIGDGDGQRHGRHRESGAKVRHQPGALVLQQGGEAR